MPPTNLLVALTAAAFLTAGCTFETANSMEPPRENSPERGVSADDLFDAYLEQDRQSIRAFNGMEAPTLIEVLDHRVERDQRVRQLMLELLRTPGAGPNDAQWTWIRLVQRMQRIDRDNASWLKAVLEQLDWFTVSQFGAEADNDAFLIVQHATHDKEFMEEVQARFERLAPLGEVALDNLALLTDRLAVMDGLPQPYGSQFECKDGEQRLQTPLADPESVVDARRADVGLPPLAEYRSLLPDCGSIISEG